MTNPQSLKSACQIQNIYDVQRITQAHKHIQDREKGKKFIHTISVRFESTPNLICASTVSSNFALALV